MEDKQLPWQEGRDAHPEAPRHRGSFCVCKGTSQLLTCKNCRWLGAIWLSHIITDVSRGVTRRTEAFHTQRSHLGRRQNTKAEAAMAWLEKNCYSQCSMGLNLPQPGQEAAALLMGGRAGRELFLQAGVLTKGTARSFHVHALKACLAAGANRES